MPFNLSFSGIEVLAVDAKAGDDLVDGSALTISVTIYGGDGDDTLIGGSNDDHLYGQDGDDDLIGNLGADYLDGGAGSDGLLGDMGTIERELISGGGMATLLTTPEPQARSLHRPPRHDPAQGHAQQPRPGRRRHADRRHRQRLPARRRGRRLARWGRRPRRAVRRRRQRFALGRRRRRPPVRRGGRRRARRRRGRGHRLRRRGRGYADRGFLGRPADRLVRQFQPFRRAGTRIRALP